MAESLGEALLYLRTDDRGLDTGIANAKGKSEQLGRTLDATSGSATKLGRAMDDAGASASTAGAKSGEYSREVSRLKAAIDPAWGSLQKFKQEAQLARQALAEGAITHKQYIEAMRQSATQAGLLSGAQRGVITQTGAQRAGMQQLSMQISDVATMYSLGARPMQIFASQIGQITQAVQLASGGTSRFAAIMGSPWTMAITTAAIVLVPLIGNLLDSEDAADKAGKANETLADKLDRSKHSTRDVIAALRDYNAEQRKANETTLEAAAAAAATAEKELRRAMALRQVLAAQLATMDQAMTSGRGAGVEGAGAMAAGRNNLQSRIDANDREMARLTQDAQDAASKVADEMAKLETDETARIRHTYQLKREAAAADIKDYKEREKAIADLYRKEKAEIEAVNAAKRSSSSASSASRAAGVGDMVALIKELFPGAQITSTTGGKHTKGSDHYAGRAIDFVPGGGIGQYSTAEVQKILEEAGVTIRRNANGTQQLFGPGRSASKPGDHDNHFHVAWSGGASPEDAQRRAERAAAAKARAEEKEARRVERYNRDLAGLQDAAADLQAKLTDTAEERYQLERQALDVTIAEQKRRIEANADYTDAEKAKLLAQLEIKASLERELLDRRRREELARQALEIAQAMNASEGELLQKQLQLTDSRVKRRDIDQQLLDLSYRDRRAALEARVNDSKASEGDRWAAFIELSNLDKNKALDQQRLDRDYESPIERYRRELVGYGDNLNDELEKVAVGALDSIADRLANIAFSANNAMDAIKGIFKQIGVEIMRLFIQQQLILPILNLINGDGASALGNIGGGSDKVSAAGTAVKLIGKSAGWFASGGIIPTGSFGIVGEAGPEPIFATDGGIGVLPNSSLRAAGAGSADADRGGLYLDLRGAVMTEDLLRQMNTLARAHARGAVSEYDRGVGAHVQDNLARRG